MNDELLEFELEVREGDRVVLSFRPTQQVFGAVSRAIYITPGSRHLRCNVPVFDTGRAIVMADVQLALQMVHAEIFDAHLRANT